MWLTERFHIVAEQIGDLTRSLFSPFLGSSVRIWRGHLTRFWHTANPTSEGTIVNYDVTRSYYRNDGDAKLGSVFAKPIVDLQVGFIGVPRISTDNENLNDFLNECVRNFWLDEIQQLMRDAIRDSKTVVRLQRPDVLDPLMTLEEAEHGALEVIPPERVEIERSARNKRVIERAIIRHRMVVVVDEGNMEEGRDPVIEEHDVLEIIDRQRYRFWNETRHEWMDELAANNPWPFVPVEEIYNEWDASLQGGQSDLETVVPFIRAFNDVMSQGLQAHGYHSTPKLVMNLADSAPFIKMNFPEAVDPDSGELKAHAEISWRGREIIFLQTEDKVEFLEAKSVLGDTRILAEFLIDCICIGSQTPEWAFMRVDSGSANSDRNAQTVPFLKKVDRKRRNFTKPIQNLLKMIMVANDLIPVRADLSWEIVRVDDEVVHTQAFQQLLMGLEVAAERGEISDDTYRRTIRAYLPAMKSSNLEAREAEKDMQERIDRLPPQPQLLQQTQRPPVVGGPQGRNE